MTTKQKPLVFDLSVAQVATLRNVKRATVYSWLEKGLAHRYEGGRVLVKRADAEAFEPGRCGFPKGQRRKLSQARRERAFKLLQSGKSISETAKKIGMNPTAMMRALTKRLAEKANG